MIEIVNLTKRFNGKIVLENLNLKVRRGETMVIIGCSGCGKSVLLKHIIGLMRPDAGNVFIDGVDIVQLEGAELDRMRMRFGMLFQGAALFDSLTVGENVGFSLAYHGRTEKTEITRRVAECLALVGLSGVEGLEPAQLSGGMRKRVGLARAVCLQPEILLYDEPTTGIDPVMAAAVNQLIIDFRDRLKVTSVVVTHDMNSAYLVADRIAMLYQGRIIFTGTPAETKSSADPAVKQFIHGLTQGPISNF